jgi:hypothetical protein
MTVFLNYLHPGCIPSEDPSLALCLQRRLWIWNPTPIILSCSEGHHLPSETLLHQSVFYHFTLEISAKVPWAHLVDWLMSHSVYTSWFPPIGKRRQRSK